MADGTPQDILDQPYTTDPACCVSNIQALAGMMQRAEARIAALVASNTSLLAQVAALSVPNLTTIVTRSLDLDFIIHAVREVEVRYAVLLPAKLLALGTDEATVALKIDGVEVHRVSNKMSLGVGLSINDQRDHIHMLTARIPAGSTVQLTTISASATAAAPSFHSGQETLL